MPGDASPPGDVFPKHPWARDRLSVRSSLPRAQSFFSLLCRARTPDKILLMKERCTSYGTLFATSRGGVCGFLTFTPSSPPPLLLLSAVFLQSFLTLPL